MISNQNSGSTEHDFLILSFPDTDFIINKTQFFTSVFVERERKIQSRVPYIRSLVEYDEELLLLFDFERFLRNTFRLRTESEYHIALVSDIAGCTDEHREFFSTLRFKGTLPVSRERIAVKVGSHAEIQPVKLQELKRIPMNLRNYEAAEGLLGCRFTAGERLQYYIDMEDLIFNSFGRRKAVKHAHSDS